MNRAATNTTAMAKKVHVTTLTARDLLRLIAPHVSLENLSATVEVISRWKAVLNGRLTKLVRDCAVRVETGGDIGCQILIRTDAGNVVEGHVVLRQDLCETQLLSMC